MAQLKSKNTKSVTKATYFTNGLVMLAYIFVFSIMGIIFVSDGIDSWIVICVSILFLLPPLAICYISGKSHGERMFTHHLKKVKDATGKSPLTYPYHTCIYYLISFATPCIVLTILAFAFKNLILRSFLYFLFLPITLLFEKMGVLLISTVNIGTLIVYLAATLLYSGVFAAAFILQMYKQKRQIGAIESELRSFNN